MFTINLVNPVNLVILSKTSSQPNSLIVLDAHTLTKSS